MTPPRWMTRVLARALPAAQRDMVLGDLEEAFHERRARGRPFPRLWYGTQAVLFAALFTMQRGRERWTDLRDGGGWRADAWVRDLRVALRSLRRRPGLTLVGVTTLGLGIGASTALFSVIDGALLQPLPYSAGDELVWVGERFQDSPNGAGGLSRANFEDLRDAVTLLEGMAAYEIESSNFAGDDEPLRIRGAKVTPGFFDVLGVGPALGRSFEAADNHRDASGTVLLTHGLWRDRFGADPGVVGRTVVVNDEPHSVVGVLPSSFTFLGEPRFFKPFRWDGLPTNRDRRDVNAVARLGRGVDLQLARDELGTVYARLAATHPDPNGNRTAWAESLRDRTVGGSERTLQLLGGAVALLLVIACVNVANLLLVRAESRRHELAVRHALGSGRSGLVPTFLGEGLVISLAGGAVGLLVAGGGVRLLVRSFGGALPRSDLIAVDARSLLFGLGLALATGLLVGAVPLLRIDGARLHHHLRRGARSTADGGNRMKRGLVAAEVALAVLLVTGAGLLARSFGKVLRVDLGLRGTESALTFRVSLSGDRYADRSAVVEFYGALEDALVALPGVTAIGLDNRTPLVGGSTLPEVRRADRPESVVRTVERRCVTSGFFAAAGVPLVAGRLWTDAEMNDTTEAGTSVVINETLAARLFPAGDAVGGRIDPGWSPDGYLVLGVVGDLHEDGPERPAPPGLYLPYPGHSPPAGMLGVVRTEGDPLVLAPHLREAVRTLDPAIPVYAVRLLSDVVAQRQGTRRFGVFLLAVFAGLALLLGATGIYGVLSFTVAERSREMGLRLVLGATRGRVRRWVLLEAFRMAVPGLTVGLLAAGVAGRFLVGMLFEVTPLDPLTYLTVTGMLAVVCLTAGLVPAVRATRVDPRTAVHAE